MTIRNLRPLARARSAWRRVRPLLGERRWRLSVLIGASVLTGLVEAGMLALVAQVAFALAKGESAVGLAGGPLDLRGSPGGMLALAAGLAILRLALQAVVSYLPARIGADIHAAMGREVFDAFVHAGWELQAREREGHLQELLATHVFRAVQAVQAVAVGLSAALTFAALVLSAVGVNLSTALLLIAVGVVMFAVLRPFGLLQRRYARRVSDGSLDVGSGVNQAARVAEEIHVFGVADAQSHRFRSLVEAVREPFFRTQFVGRLVPAAYQSVAILLLIGGLALVAALGDSRLATLGTVVLILVRSLSYGQLVQMAYTQLNELMPFVDRVQQALAAFRSAVPRDAGRRLESIEGLELRSTGFAYQPGRPVLRSVDLALPAGRAVAIVGASGAGKSTLVQLLLRLRAPTDGFFLVNGRDASDWSRRDWQRLVAAVPQDPKLIRGTIAENIRFLRPHVDDVAVERAARLAHIHDEIQARPGAYDAIVDQRADALSGGQRQRLCLARALAGGPELLILDEPTSALDARSEELILETLHELKGSVTIVVVAHRRALLDVCDDVWHIRDAEVTVESREHNADELEKRALNTGQRN